MKIGDFMHLDSPRLETNETDFDCAIISAGEIKMKKLDSNWKSIQGSMALEGHYISDEALLKIANEYEASGDEELLNEAAKIAEKSGRPVFDVFEELKAAKEHK